MKLIQLTDIHLTTPGQTIGGRDSNANFARALDHALDQHGDADLLAITGDLSDWGDAADYAALHRALTAVPMPVLLCIGNHDHPDRFKSAFPGRVDADGFVQTVQDVAGLRCLALDTTLPGSHGGIYCATRRAWLEARLTEHPGPFLIFMHHNPMPIGLAPFDRIGLAEGAAFRALVGRHAGRIRHVFFGHTHLPLAGSIGGVPVSSLRGTNHAAYPAYAETKRLSGSDLPEAYAIATVADDHVSVLTVEYGYTGRVYDAGSPDRTEWDRATMAR